MCLLYPYLIVHDISKEEYEKLLKQYQGDIHGLLIGGNPNKRKKGSSSSSSTYYNTVKDSDSDDEFESVQLSSTSTSSSKRSSKQVSYHKHVNRRNRDATKYTCKNNNVHENFLVMTDDELTIPYIADGNNKLVPDKVSVTKIADKVNEEILNAATADFKLHRKEFFAMIQR